MSEQCEYDVIIIGAGISGLVCGCYLAKAGLKVLIIEKNVRPGGCCFSFVRQGYHFDACAHGLGSLRKGARLDTVLNDLDLYKKISFIRKDPSDVIHTPDYNISIFNSLDKTIVEFQKDFPKEKDQIRDFFKYVANSTLKEFIKHRSRTLQELLDDFFCDETLKAILSVFILGFVGCSPYKISAVVACLVFREFVLDGGYRPSGGMQEFPDALLKRFIEFGGSIQLSRVVNKIILSQGVAKGVVLSNKDEIYAKYVVSACDLRQTFLGFVGADKLSKRMIEKIQETEVSMSLFVVYLGMKDDYQRSQKQGANIWIINNYDIKSILSNDGGVNHDCLLITTSENVDSMKNTKSISVRLETVVPSMNDEFWSRAKSNETADKFINLAEKVLPGLSEKVLFKFSASPKTINRWTNNYLGAGFGWASSPHQFGDPDFSQKTEIENLFIAGHWSNESSGIAFVANSGFNAATLILNRTKR